MSFKESVHLVVHRYPGHVILVGGDFNLKSIDWDLASYISGGTDKQSCELLLDTFSENCLEQLNRQPTRNGNILDLIATNRPDLINDVCVETGISDHDIVIASMVTKVHNPVKNARSVFLLGKADKQMLRSHLENEWASFNSGTIDVEELWTKSKCIVNEGSHLRFFPITRNFALN